MTQAGQCRTTDAVRLLPVLLLLAWTGVAQAQFNYTTNDGSITITGYTGSNKTVVIPSTIDGLPVTTIGTQAFFDRNDVQRVAITNNVVRIEKYAFSSCRELGSLVVGPQVRTIENNAFSYCHKLTNIVLAPDALAIGDNAFRECLGLRKLTIPSGVILIGESAFSDCRSLTNIVLGDTLTNITRRVFSGCNALRDIQVDPLNPTYSSVNGILLDKSQRVLVAFPEGRSEGFILPDTVTSIGEDVLWRNTTLVELNIPNTVTNIGRGAFSFNSFLRVSIPGSVMVIQDNAFTWCGEMESLTLANGLRTIGHYAFGHCFKLKSLRIPDSTQVLGSFAFSGSALLEEVKIGKGMSVIHGGVFRGVR